MTPIEYVAAAIMEDDAKGWEEITGEKGTGFRWDDAPELRSRQWQGARKEAIRHATTAIRVLIPSLIVKGRE